MPSRSAKQASPPTPRRPSSPAKPSLSLRLLASAVSISPFLFDYTATELLHPLFSSSRTRALEATVPLYASLIAIFLAQRTFVNRSPSWRTCWFILGISRILSEGVIRWYGEKLLGFGLEKGVLIGRFLLEGIPFFAIANWTWDQFRSKDRAQFIPGWFIPFSWFASTLLGFLDLTPHLGSLFPNCYILQLQGIFLVSIALFANHSSLHRVPRSHHHHNRHQSPSRSRSLTVRLILFAVALALAHFVATSSSHCPTSQRLVPPPTTSSRILASKKSLTGYISVGEQEVPGPNGATGYRFRYLRADHSLLGGLWTGVSEMELRRSGSRVTEEEIVKRAESIYSTFIVQELVRLVETPEDLPRQAREQGLVIGLGAGLIARTLDQHGVNLTICEIDPTVYEYARQYFAVAEPAEVVLRDAERWLVQGGGQGKLFDYIVHDVFTGGQVPSSLFTVEFWSIIRQRLHHSGVLAVNFAGTLSSSASRLVLSTLLYSFPHCRAFEDSPSSSSTNSTVGNEDTLKNLVVFCSPSWFNPIEFRNPLPKDYLPYPSPQIRKKVFDDYASLEIPLDRFELVKEDEEGGKTKDARKLREEWILTDKKSKRLDKAQVAGTREHWRAMEKVLPRETWASW
ncbi:hypothetical protein JCM16303_007067 [Sporobolomyces ruberrimus]